MLDVARKKVGPARFYEGDMRTFRLDERFDAVTCLFSSIGYLADTAELDAAVANMAQHLNPGGLLVVEPWHHSDVWPENHSFAMSAMDGERSIARVMRVSVEDGTSILDMHFGIADSAGVRSFDEQHRLRLFSVEEYLAAFENAGLAVTHEPEGITGRGLFIGAKAVEAHAVEGRAVEGQGV